MPTNFAPLQGVQEQCAQRGPVKWPAHVVTRLHDAFAHHNDHYPGVPLLARDGGRWGRWLRQGSAGPDDPPDPADLPRGSTDPPLGPRALAPPNLRGSLGASRATLFTSRTADCRTTG